MFLYIRGFDTIDDSEYYRAKAGKNIGTFIKSASKHVYKTQCFASDMKSKIIC